MEIDSLMTLRCACGHPAQLHAHEYTFVSDETHHVTPETRAHYDYASVPCDEMVERRNTPVCTISMCAVCSNCAWFEYQEDVVYRELLS